MTLMQTLFGALAQKYNESKPVLDSELLEYATPKQVEMLARYDALSKEGNKTAGVFALALRIKLAKAMEDARIAAEEAAEQPKRVVRAKRVKKK